MAKAKDLNEVYLCETDADRESIVPYAGQKCIMQNGDIYVCFRAGVWGKIGAGDEGGGVDPIDPTTTVLDIDVDWNVMWEPPYGLSNFETNFELEVGSTYTVTVTQNINSEDIISVFNNVEATMGEEGFPTLYCEKDLDTANEVAFSVLDNCYIVDYEGQQVETNDNYMVLEGGKYIIHIKIEKE